MLYNFSKYQSIYDQSNDKPKFGNLSNSVIRTATVKLRSQKWENPQPQKAG